VDFEPTQEEPTDKFPFLLTTGRTLYQFNAGTMTMRTQNVQLRKVDTLDIAPSDAKTLRLKNGDHARIFSRYGEAVLPVCVDSRLKQGNLFATFHTPEAYLNRLTGPHRDSHVQTPEYKIVAVNVAKE
jgi:formate dehydrogenase major subunit